MNVNAFAIRTPRTNAYLHANKFTANISPRSYFFEQGKSSADEAVIAIALTYQNALRKCVYLRGVHQWNRVPAGEEDP